MDSDIVTNAHLQTQVRDGLDHVADRLDLLVEQQRIANGRTTKLEDRLNSDVGLVAHEVRMKNLEREVFRPDRAVHAIVKEPTSGDNATFSISLTPRMWKLLIAIGGALATFGPILGEWLKSLFFHAVAK